MAWAKVTDIAYGRLRSPDLDVMEEFLTRFGMLRAERTANALYMRGTDPAHHIHVTEKGDPKFVGFAYYAASEDDLQAARQGARRVRRRKHRRARRRQARAAHRAERLSDRGGLRHREQLAPIPVKRQKLNSGEAPTARAGELMRLPKGPSHVKRIGHGVMMTPKFKETVGWFRETLGFICSDDVYAGEKDNLIGSFNRCDRGDDLCRSSRLLLPQSREDRPQPRLVRGAGHRRRLHGPRLSRAVRQVRAHVGHRPAPARQPGLRLLGRSVGPRARALGRQRPAQSRRTARNLIAGR